MSRMAFLFVLSPHFPHTYLVNRSFITSRDNESVTVNEKNPPDFKKEPEGSHQDDQF